MKTPLFAHLALTLICQSAFAQNSAPERELIIAAVGEMPIPRMKLVESMGRTGYQADETSVKNWFPQKWNISMGEASRELILGLNMEPTRLKIPAEPASLSLSPSGTKPKPGRTLPKSGEGGPTIMVIFNREPEKSWEESYDARFLTCNQHDEAKPAATVLNLSGAILSLVDKDRTRKQLTPGKSTTVPIFVNSERGIRLLPLTATVQGKSYQLDVTPLNARPPYMPVVVVYPSASGSKSARPLKVSVIQPSAALPSQGLAASPAPVKTP